MFVSQPKARFYDGLFSHLDVSVINSAHAKTGRKSQKEALFCAFIVMKCEGFSQITDLPQREKYRLHQVHYRPR